MLINERGGNASNSCTVLATLGMKPTFFGTLAYDAENLSPETRYVLDSFQKAGVTVHPDCPKFPGLPELLLEDFTKLELAPFTWIHFEGRNNTELLKILEHLQSLPVENRIKFSVEVEKVGRNHEEFIPYADLVLVSKDIAKSHGCSNKEDAIKYFYHKVKLGCRLIVAWGEDGAAGTIRTNEEEAVVLSSPAFPPTSGVVDTIGAGDTFNAAIIACTSLNIPLQQSLTTACKVAGKKVSIQGFSNLGNIQEFLQ